MITIATRIQYSRHVLRGHLQGFAPMTLEQFRAKVAAMAPML